MYHIIKIVIINYNFIVVNIIMKSLSEMLLEKLKVTKKSLSAVLVVDEHTVEVPYYEFVIWYTGHSNKTPNELTEEDFRSSDFADNIVDINGVEIFKNARLAYNFYENHKDDIATITTKEEKKRVKYNDTFFNTIKLNDINIVFYAYSFDNFKEYIQYHQEIGEK